MDLLGLAALHQVGSLSHTDLEPTDAHSFLQVPSASRVFIVIQLYMP